jgi:hypothetical protein
MKIYRLEVNQVHSPMGAVISSHQSKRTPQKCEHFATIEKAEARRNEINEGISCLIGYTPAFEVVIIPIEVTE